MKFSNLDEIDLYFSGDVVECLECHKMFKHLANHVMMKHRLTTDEYKLKYNIPLNYSLASKAYRDKQSKALTKRIKTGEFNYNHLPDAINKAKLAKRTRTTIERTAVGKSYLKIRKQIIDILKSAYFGSDLDESNIDKKELKKIINKMSKLLLNKETRNDINF